MKLSSFVLQALHAADIAKKQAQELQTKAEAKQQQLRSDALQVDAERKALLQEQQALEQYRNELQRRMRALEQREVCMFTLYVHSILKDLVCCS